MDNMSGYGDFFESQEDFSGWSWGAFSATWLWGLFNETFVALLGLIPGVNILVSIYLGVNGNKLAWKNKRWESQGKFLKTQKRWARFGWVIFVLSNVLFVGIIYNKVELVNEKEYILEESYNLIFENEEAMNFIGDDLNIIEYIRGSSFIWKEAPHSIVVKTERGKYWAAVRLNENSEIYEILLSHYYIIEGFHEVIIRRDSK
jgi:hypothetical protein